MAAGIRICWLTSAATMAIDSLKGHCTLNAFCISPQTATEGPQQDLESGNAAQCISQHQNIDETPPTYWFLCLILAKLRAYSAEVNDKRK